MSVAGAMAVEAARMSVPYVAAALGGVVTERSGVVHIALEAQLLAGAFVGVAVALATGSVLVGAAGGVVAGALVGALHGFDVVFLRVDAVVGGLALNLLAAAGTRLALRLAYGSSANSPSLDAGPAGLFGLDAFVLGLPVLVAAVGVGLAATPAGLRLRAAGEAPEVTRAMGLDVGRIRLGACIVGGALAGYGGAALGLGLRQFQAGMSGGRGFVALAAVVLARWAPGRAALVCLAFAGLEAAQIVLQGATHLPPQLLSALPYAATLAVLAFAPARRGAHVGGALSP